MSLFGIAWRTIRQRLLTSGLTALSLALGVALVVATLVIGNIVTQAFKSGSGLGYNMIVGAKGSPLQLVLNSVYLVSKPIENISWAFYEEFLPAASRPDGVAGTFAGSVQTAVPICMGDYFSGYRVIGTSAAYFDRLTYGGGAPAGRRGGGGARGLAVAAPTGGE
jgi:putative ABC transport system permease protein